MVQFQIVRGSSKKALHPGVDSLRAMSKTLAGRAITPPLFVDHSCRIEPQHRVCKPVFGAWVLPKVVSFKKMLAGKGL